MRRNSILIALTRQTDSELVILSPLLATSSWRRPHSYKTWPFYSILRASIQWYSWISMHGCNLAGEKTIPIIHQIYPTSFWAYFERCCGGTDLSPNFDKTSTRLRQHHWLNDTSSWKPVVIVALSSTKYIVTNTIILYMKKHKTDQLRSAWHSFQKPQVHQSPGVLSPHHLSRDDINPL